MKRKFEVGDKVKRNPKYLKTSGISLDNIGTIKRIEYDSYTDAIHYITDFKGQTSVWCKSTYLDKVEDTIVSTEMFQIY